MLTRRELIKQSAWPAAFSRTHLVRPDPSAMGLPEKNLADIAAFLLPAKE